MTSGDTNQDSRGPLEVSYREEGEWGVLDAIGELDVVTSSSLTAAVKDIRPGINVVVDMSNTTFVDSTGLGVLIGMQRRVEQAGGAFRLVVTSPHIRRVFEITGLTDVFYLSDSLDAARTQ